MDMYSTQGWDNFFVAQAGAAAALSGLLFVALSINLNKILDVAHMPGRAAETIALLLNVLFVALILLIPHQTPGEQGCEILVIATCVWLFCVRNAWRYFCNHSLRNELGFHWRWIAVPILIGQVATLPFLLAGISQITQMGGGLYWVAFGVLCAFSACVLNTWVLLVEILR